MKRKQSIALIVACCLAVIPAVTGYCQTMYGTVRDYDGLSSDRKDALQVDAQLARAAYLDESIPPGYRAATRPEFNQYIGLTSSQRIMFDSTTGYFHSVGGTSWFQSILGLGFNDGNGLGGRLLINETDGSIVLAFRGTESSFNDIANTDIPQFFGGTPDQYKEAAEMLNNLVRNTENSQQQIKVVGHSLGGGEASYATMNCDDVSRVTTSTFNAAGIAKSNVNKKNINNTSKVINNVRVDKDVVSRTGYLIGDTYVVNSEWLFAGGDNTSSGDSVFDAGVQLGDATARAAATHSINFAITAMRGPVKFPSKDGDKFSSPDDTSPGGDLVADATDNDTANGDIFHSSGDTGNGGSPSGDSVSSPSDNGNDSDDKYYSLILDDDSSGSDEMIIDGDYMTTDLLDDTDALMSLLDDAGFLDRIKDSLSDNISAASLPSVEADIPVIMPNFGYKRIMFLYSGEDVTDQIVDKGTSLVRGSLGNLRSSLDKVFRQNK